MIEAPSRRGFLTGLGAILAAPAIVRVASLMPVKALPAPWTHVRYGLGYKVTDLENSLRAFMESDPSVNEAMVEAMLFGQSWLKIGDGMTQVISSVDIGVVPRL